jgi:hypothetical protein
LTTECHCEKESQNGQFISKIGIWATHTMEYQPKAITPGLFHIPEDGWDMLKSDSI